jgi:hypothetical protein
LSDNIVKLSYTNSYNLVDTVTFDVITNKILINTHHLPIPPFNPTLPVIPPTPAPPVNPTTPTNNYILAELGKEYTGPDGLTVILKTFTKRSNGAGTTYYNIGYTLKNNTADKKVIEGNFELLYRNKAGSEQQYGFFNYLLPGESTTRSYEFKTLDSEEMSFVKYNEVIKSANQAPVLYWAVPQ